MKSDSDEAMTPDYAKKIFLSRSGKTQTRHLKTYSVVAVMLLLGVVLWGLFQVQEEWDSIDQSMVRLGRDPMPGRIPPRAEKKEPGLFTPTLVQSDIKTMDIIATEQEAGPVATEPVVETEEPVGSSSDLTPVSDEGGRGDVVKSEVSELASQQQASTGIAPQQVAAGPAKKRSGSTQASSLQISSSSQADEKNQLLQAAYAAYVQGNLESASSQYDQVLSLDESNRDAILGRAAIHVQQNEYPQAIQRYQQMLLINPKDSMAMASLISVANIEPRVGETQLKSLLREQPETAYLHFALGNMYGLQGRWNDAQTAYFNALKYQSDEPNYAYNLAVSLEHMGKAGMALNFYRKALDNMSSGLVTFNSQLVSERIQVLSE